MAGKIKLLPKVLAGLAVVGIIGFFANKALDKVPNAPVAATAQPAQEQPATIQPAPAQEQPAPAPVAPAAKADAFDALIHEAGKK